MLGCLRKARRDRSVRQNRGLARKLVGFAVRAGPAHTAMQAPHQTAEFPRFIWGGLAPLPLNRYLAPLPCPCRFPALRRARRDHRRHPLSRVRRVALRHRDGSRAGSLDGSLIPLSRGAGAPLSAPAPFLSHGVTSSSEMRLWMKRSYPSPIGRSSSTKIPLRRAITVSSVFGFNPGFSKCCQ